MRSVKSLIAELQKFPEDAFCYAYEGEVTGVIVYDCGRSGLDSQLGYIECWETWDGTIEDTPAVQRKVV